MTRLAKRTEGFFSIRKASYLLTGIEGFGARDELAEVLPADLAGAGVLACEFEESFECVFTAAAVEAVEEAAVGVGALLAGAWFIALLLFGEVSELRWSVLGVFWNWPERYWSRLYFRFAGFAIPLVESFGVFVSGSGLSRRYFPEYSGRSRRVVYSKQRQSWFSCRVHERFDFSMISGLAGSLSF